MEVFDVSKSAEKEEETESVKDDLEVTNILKTNDKVICIELFFCFLAYSVIFLGYTYHGVVCGLSSLNIGKLIGSLESSRVCDVNILKEIINRTLLSIVNQGCYRNIF